MSSADNDTHRSEDADVCVTWSNIRNSLILFRLNASVPDVCIYEQQVAVQDDVLEYLRRLVLSDDQMTRRFRNLISTDYNRILEKCLRLSRYVTTFNF
jgi:thiamine phosphate synthase YjbQ (UPF0047 family)